MPTAVLTRKGQVTIPLAVREIPGLDTGDRIDFVDLGNGQFALMPATEDVSALRGVLKRPPRPVTFDQAAARGAAMQMLGR